MRRNSEIFSIIVVVVVVSKMKFIQCLDFSIERDLGREKIGKTSSFKQMPLF